MPRGYTILKIYVIICDLCNEDITRGQSGEEPTTYQEALDWIKKHKETWHTN